MKPRVEPRGFGGREQDWKGAQLITRSIPHCNQAYKVRRPAAVQMLIDQIVQDGIHYSQMGERLEDDGQRELARECHRLCDGLLADLARLQRQYPR